MRLENIKVFRIIRDMFKKQNEGRSNIWQMLWLLNIIFFSVIAVGVFTMLWKDNIITPLSEVIESPEVVESPDVEIFLYSFWEIGKIENQEKKKEVVIMGIFKDDQSQAVRFERFYDEERLINKEGSLERFKKIFLSPLPETIKLRETGKTLPRVKAVQNAIGRYEGMGKWGWITSYKLVEFLTKNSAGKAVVNVPLVEANTHLLTIRVINLNEFLKGDFLTDRDKLSVRTYLENPPKFDYDFLTDVRGFYKTMVEISNDQPPPQRNRESQGTSISQATLTPEEKLFVGVVVIVVLVLILLLLWWKFRDKIVEFIDNFLEGLPPSRKEFQMEINGLRRLVLVLEGIAQEWKKSSRLTSAELNDGDKYRLRQIEDTQKGFYPPISELQQQVNQMDTKLKDLSQDITKLDMSVRWLKEEREDKDKEITKINTKLKWIDDNSEKIEANSKRIEGLASGINESVKTIKELDQKFSERISSLGNSILELEQLELEQLIENDKKSTRNPATIIKWYEDLENEIYSELIGKNSPYEIVEKMKGILEIISMLKVHLSSMDKEKYKEILEVINDFGERLNERLNLLRNQIPKPEIEKEILRYERYKETIEKELVNSILSGKDDIPFIDIEAEYQKYVEDKCMQSLKEFKNQLESQKASILETDTYQQKVYDDFLHNDLISLFIESIDRIKRTNEFGIPVEVEKALKEIFDIVKIEEIPVEVNKTEADPRLYIIEGSKVGDYEDGIVVELISRGLRDKNTKKEIRKPVVIRGERR